LDEITHNIATHQVHHLFPIIPHYHLVEATAAFRKHFATHVRHSHTPIVSAFMQQSHSYAWRRHIDNAVDAVVV
jgi:omega-3 fatty acid desaturase (delta-15 desaturase)